MVLRLTYLFYELFLTRQILLKRTNSNFQLMKLSISPVFIITVLLLSCHSSRKTTSSPQDKIILLPPRSMEAGVNKEAATMEKTDPLMEDLLNAHPQHFSAILKNRDSMKVQIIYTQINRDVNNQPLFRNYYFHLDPEMYFYPASTVKMPVAVLALQRLNELKVFGLNSHSTMIT